MSTSLLLAFLSITQIFVAAPARPPGDRPAVARAEAPRANNPRAPARTDELWNPVTFANVLTGLPTAYYDPKRLPPREAFLAALGRLERAVPEVVVFPPDLRGVVRMIAGRRERRIRTDGIQDWMKMGDQLLDILRWVDLALGDPSRRDELQYAAIKGTLSVLDPHTVFFTPEEYARQQSRFTGSMVGVGVQLTALEGRIVVREVVPRGPADRAGVKVGDVLVQVDALEVASLSPEAVAERLRGEASTEVTLVVERRGQRLTYKMTRAELVIPSVHAELLPGRVALVRISGFPKNTLEVFTQAVAPLLRQRPVAWILDLRGNEGGYIMQAARMADYFLAKGLICKALGKGGQNVITWEVKPRADRIDAPLVVLVDRGTASAAEILAGTLSANGRALLLGERTWGKGTVQKLFPMPDRSVLKLTMWQYLLAGDIPIQSAAIMPDVALTRVRLDRGRMRFLTASNARGESSQRRRIDAIEGGAQVWKGRPMAPPLRYLVTTQAAAAPTPGTPLPAAPADPVLELAREIATAGRGRDREGLLKDAAPLVEAFRARQESAILARLLALGVDWRAPPPSAPLPVLSATLAATPAKPVAGQKVTLTLTVENNGQTDAHRVGATFDSHYDLFDGRELLVGHLAPGQKRSLSLESDLHPGLIERWDLVLAHIQAGGGKSAAEAQAVLHIQELPRPRFRITWLVDDRKGGNGDGLLSPGETASLRVWVQNLGPGTARSAQLDALQPMGGLTLDRTRVALPELAPGATEQGSLPISLSALDRRTKGRASLTLALYDSDLGGGLEVQVVFPRIVRGNDFLPATVVVTPRGDDIHLSSFAGPDAPRVGFVRSRTRLRAEATRGTWMRVSLPDKRVAFVTSDDVTPASGGPIADGYAPEWLASAPEVVLAELPSVSVDPDLPVSGHASASIGVKDLWVRVWNPQADLKEMGQIHYEAAPPEGTRRLGYKAKVPLQPGNNYVVVDARDLTGVKGEIRRTVYRPPADDRSTTRPPPRSPASEDAPKESPPSPPKDKPGCRCDMGQAVPLPLLMVPFAFLLLALWRRRHP